MRALRTLLLSHGLAMLVGKRSPWLVSPAPGCKQEGVDEIKALLDTLLHEGSDLSGVASGLRHRITVRRMRRRREVAALLAPIALVGCSVVGAPSAVPPSPATTPTTAVPAALQPFYDQPVRWVNCGPADCATITAPLDYARPTDGTIDLAITRVAATGDRLGTLFVNPGGPGGSATDYARLADAIVGGPIRERYDIVGLDPRGVGRSSPVECLTDEQLDELGAADGTPDSPEEEAAVVDLSRLPGEGCSASTPDQLPHVGTVDSARDLDIARAVAGDEVLNYVGRSYGTMLGATYAELFPDRVGRMVLDGALPASLDLVEVTRGQAVGFELALRDFVADCLQQRGCPLSGEVDEAQEQLREWIASLDADPIHTGDRDLNESLAAYAILSNLYVPEYDYPRLRDALDAAMNRGDGNALLNLLDARISRGPDGRYTDNSTEAFYAVTCLDRPYLGSVEEVRILAADWAEQAPTFGPSLAWGLLTCQGWPAAGERITTTRAEGSNPILVVSTTRDPATPYAWGEVLVNELENSRLLTYDGIGHTAYLRGSGCVDEAVDEFLLSGSLPPNGTVCS